MSTKNQNSQAAKTNTRFSAPLFIKNITKAAAGILSLNVLSIFLPITIILNYIWDILNTLLKTLLHKILKIILYIMCWFFVLVIASLVNEQNKHPEGRGTLFMAGVALIFYIWVILKYHKKINLFFGRKLNNFSGIPAGRIGSQMKNLTFWIRNSMAFLDRWAIVSMDTKDNKGKADASLGSCSLLGKILTIFALPVFLVSWLIYRIIGILIKLLKYPACPITIFAACGLGQLILFLKDKKNMDAVRYMNTQIHSNEKVLYIPMTVMLAMLACYLVFVLFTMLKRISGISRIFYNRQFSKAENQIYNYIFQHVKHLFFMGAGGMRAASFITVDTRTEEEIRRDNMLVIPKAPPQTLKISNGHKVIESH